MRLRLLTFLFLAGSAPLAAQEATDCSKAELSEVDQLICENETLQRDEKALIDVWNTWKTGVNGERINYLEGDQQKWLDSRAQCLSEKDPVSCLNELYQERTRVLTQSRIFKSETTNAGVNFEQHAALSPFVYDSLEVDKRIEGYEFLAEDLSEARANLGQFEDEECQLCSRERVVRLRIGYDSPNLLVINQSELESMDESDEIYRYRTRVYDKTTGEEIGFLGLFDPSTAPFAKKALVGEIMAQLDALNLAVSGNEDGEIGYYWPEMEQTLSELDNEEWDKMGFFPVVDGGKIAGFTYKSDAYEFAPYKSSTYFSNFEIETTPILSFLKPQYRENFN